MPIRTIIQNEFGGLSVSHFLLPRYSRVVYCWVGTGVIIFDGKGSTDTSKWSRHRKLTDWGNAACSQSTGRISWHQKFMTASRWHQATVCLFVRYFENQHFSILGSLQKLLVLWSFWTLWFLPVLWVEITSIKTIPSPRSFLTIYRQTGWTEV